MPAAPLATVVDTASALVLAQSGGGSQGGGGGLTLILMLVALVAVFYFLIIRPQQKRAKQHQELVRQIQPGDEIVTIGGLYADVVELAEDRVLVQAYDGTQMEFLRSAIARRVVEDAAVLTPTDVDEDIEDADADVDEPGDEVVDEVPEQVEVEDEVEVAVDGDTPADEGSAAAGKKDADEA